MLQISLYQHVTFTTCLTMDGLGHDFVSRTVNIFIAIFAVLIIIGTVFGNSLVILSILMDRRLHRVGNIFIVSLALSDILVGLCVTPFALVYQLQGVWNFGSIFCDFWISMDIICCTASIVNLCVISYDRYNAISQPLHYAQFRTVRRALCLVILAWTYSIVIALPPLLGWKTPNQMTINSCVISQNVGYTFFSTIGAFYLPLAIMLCFYCKIFQVTWLRGKQWVRGPGNSLIIKFRQKKGLNSYNTFRYCCDTGKKEGKNLSIEKNSDESKENHIEKVTVDNGMQPSFDHQINIEKPTCTKSKRPTLVRQISYLSSTDSGYTTSGEASVSSDAREDQGCMPSIAEDEIITEIVDIETGKLIIKGRDGQDTNGVNIPKSIPKPNVTGKKGHVTTARKRRRLKRKDTISLPQERRAVRTLGIVVGCFLVCWLPFFIIAILVPLCPHCVFPKAVQSLALFLGYFNSACNPVIYTFFNKEFRAAFKKILCCKFNVSAPTYL